MRPRSGISSPPRPRGCPWPSQCSSSARIASAVGDSSPSRYAISAPRSQRACMSARVTCPSDLIASSRSTRVRTDLRGATVRSDQAKAGSLRDQSTRLDERLAKWSSAPNSAAMRAELAEHPASLSSSA
jgi:hypothetical protein